MEKNYTEAINIALKNIMKENPKSIIWGPGSRDPKRVFGTTESLLELFGDKRVVDGPISEAAYTGMALGMSLGGYLPIIHFQRIDFMYMAWDQIVNNICKWSTMFGEQINTPIILRAIIGRGWGQGQQHSQNPLAMLVNLPGIDVYTPDSPQNAYDTFIHCSAKKSPSLIVEHRWLSHFNQNINTDQVSYAPETKLENGNDYTIVSYSYSSVEAKRAASYLKKHNIHCDVISLNHLNATHWPLAAESINKTKNVLLFDLSWEGFSPIYYNLSKITQKNNVKLNTINLPASYTPASQQLVSDYYPTCEDIVEFICNDLNNNIDNLKFDRAADKPHYEKNFW